jgi:indolepyruvate ferredoxin oxidoreductase beta subunit
MKKSGQDVLIAGVGGQGVLLVSELLSEACLRAGYDVKKSEVHGMAQRGGSVVSHVRYGRKVRSPLVEKGTAEVLVALEELEALRWAEYLRDDGAVIVNTQQVKPLPVAVGLQSYPENVIARLGRSKKLAAIDAVTIARRAGQVRTLNIVMLGALAAYLDLDRALLGRIMASRVPRNTVKANRLAFSGGWKAMQEAVLAAS